MPSADQIPVKSSHSTMWVVLIALSTGSALRAVHPSQPSHHAECSARSCSSRKRGRFFVTFTPGHHRPRHSGDLVGERDRCDLAGSPRQQSCKPGPMPSARTAARQRGRHSAGQIPPHCAGIEVSDDLSHLNNRPCTLHQCRAHSLHQVQCFCRCCQPLRSPGPLTSGTSITGMATASFPAIISRPTTAFQFMVRRDQSAALQAMRQATGIMAGGTISAILGFSMDATTAAVSARAGLGRPSGGCGIVGRSAQKVRLVAPGVSVTTGPLSPSRRRALAAHGECAGG
jgi:hypothetical protein